MNSTGPSLASGPAGRRREVAAGAGVRLGAASAGADDEIRTRDIDLGKVALYQLSYVRRPASRPARMLPVATARASALSRAPVASVG